ncbi:polymorphic toxin-type HINT domain-containing protein [Phytohabitans aurantiacus]|uniref:Hint domain-containing protein n=1 Tax=Phytohabitans aurantiacus TaxID=3016789 RepID=A0ABQ5R0J4_9ACTN|nr:polymorphic toxin-type HINT domain-containing protein [Phytohabitans aurantiacus]GLH99934.1 hypothetical protein Pa4123_52100 [Phytohabitans aurantiacus]
MRLIAVAAAATLTVTLAPQVTAPAEAEAPFAGLEPQRHRSVQGKDAQPGKAMPATEAVDKVWPAPSWPPATTVDVVLSKANGAAGSLSGAVRAGSLPVRIGVAGAGRSRAAGSVPVSARVQMLSQEKARTAGVNGLLLRVGRTDEASQAGAVNVQVDYSSFRHAYGADWSSRLRLVRLPECALTAARTSGCKPVPLASRNDVRAATVSADVPASPATASSSGTLLALAAGPSGGAGDYGASSLAPSSTWGHGGHTGGFTWSYPLRTPPGVGGPAPTLSLSYASQSVDGRHAATNNQPGPIGEGFDLEPGFIERRYKNCSDDTGGNANNTTETGDLCWGTDNAVLSLGGSSTELLKGSDGQWHARDEDGSKIEQIASSVDNGDNNGEYWKVTTADGTQYWFGRHRLPGWSAGRPTTDSVLAVPVYGNNLDEPCRASTFTASRCSQAWRWNLDYIQDVHGNTMSLWWTRETNYYAANMDTDSPIGYHRGGYLTRIDYGSDNRDNNEYAAASPYIENTPGRVDFTPADRCLSSNCGTKNATTWPDTPWDQECTATSTECLNGSPTFWSAKRLSVVTTKVWKATTSSYQPVDSWTLRHSFPDPGDGTRAGLWLEGITQRGLNGTTITLPEVTFGRIQMSNRVDASGSDWALAMNWWRLNSVRTETGGQIYVTYSGPECVAGSNLPAALDNNAKRCFPVRWEPPAYTSLVTDYFHKYVVTEVQQIDHTGGAETVVTRYEYKNPNNLPLWRYDDDDGLVAASRKSWGQWRGYPTVVTKVGEGADQTKTETLYFRGMHGDKLAAGGTRNATVQGLEGGATTDYDHFAGMAREQITWLGSTVLSATVTDPWRSDPPTATRAGTPPTEARYVGNRTVRTRTALDGGAWRRTTTTTTYDAYGMPTAVDDLGDDATTADDRCAVTEYVRNTVGTNWLLTPVKRIHSWADDCNTAATSGTQVISDTRHSYDNLAYGTAPTKGAVTTAEEIKDWNGGNRAYKTVGTKKYDVHGRVTESTDVTGQMTKTDYTPTTGGPLTQTVTTNPLLWADKVEIDPAWGSTVKSTDANLRVTEIAYDALGRTTSVWLPSRARTTFPNDPSTGYTYHLSTTVNVPSSITTRTINARGTYRTSYELIDALGRSRQTQQVAVGGGRVITDAFYDSAGRNWKANNPYFNSGAAGTTLYLGFDADMPSQTQTLFDAAGRPTHGILFTSQASTQVEKWRTSTTYHGDHANTTPPEGGTSTTVWTDARGRTTKLWQYHSPTPAGTYDETKYAYDHSDRLASVTDPSGNTWSYTYDIRGRQTHVDDPDKGLTEIGYNDFDQRETVEDARGITLAYTYDVLGRRATVRDGSITGTKRAEWVYDTPAKGLLKSASRWVGTDEYKTETVTVDVLYRPTQTRVIIPASQGKLAGTYTFRASYLADGSPNTSVLPAVGGLTAETLTYGYDNTYALPDTLASNYAGSAYYVIDSVYTNLNQHNLTTRATAMTGAASLQSGQYYDAATGRVTRRPTTKSVGTSYISNATYDYDDVGNITKINDVASAGETQCFTHDHLGRLARAWTPASTDCATEPTAAGLGGPAPYWNSWSFGDADDPNGRIGNRVRQVEHATAAGDVTTDYTYDGNGANQPHTLTSTARTDNNGTITTGYEYDPAGNTESRPGPNGQQTLTWDNEGHLETVTDTAGANSYIYDADGNRLIAKDPTGATLYLPGTEVRLTTATDTVSATRYYTFNGELVAQRTPSGLTWLAADHQGTSQIAVTADATQTVTRRRQTPYGTPRGATPAWPNKLGYVGGYQDDTGLTHLGAREYDPATGRFISVDPVQDMADPQQWNGYAYANNGPITRSDPSGLMAESGGGGGKYVPPPTGGQAPAPTPKPKKTLLGKITSGLGKGWLRFNIDPIISVADVVVTGAQLAYNNVTAAANDEKSWGDAMQEMVDYKTELDVAYVSSPIKLVEETVDEAGAAVDAAAKGDVEGFFEHTYMAVGNVATVVIPGGAGVGAARTAAGALRGGIRGGARNLIDCRKNSFVPGTLVLLADGTRKPIETLVIGDEVLATDPETGETDGKKVAATIEGVGTKELVQVTVAAKNGPAQTIVATDGHPFWVETAATWRDAAALQPGDELLRPDGSRVRVVDILVYGAIATVHNLTVRDIHTYYVIAGKTPVLVHNCGDGLLHPGRNGADDSPQDWIPMSSWTRNGTNLAEGTHHFVVMPDKSVRTFHESIWEIAPGAGHTSLSRGKGVLAAGTFDVGPGGVINRFDNFSGHYRPGVSTEGVIRDSLGRNGFNLNNAQWDPFEFN